MLIKLNIILMLLLCLAVPCFSQQMTPEPNEYLQEPSIPDTTVVRDEKPRLNRTVAPPPAAVLQRKRDQEATAEPSSGAGDRFNVQTGSYQLDMGGGDSVNVSGGYNIGVGGGDSINTSTGQYVIGTE